MTPAMDETYTGIDGFNSSTDSGLTHYVGDTCDGGHRATAIPNVTIAPAYHRQRPLSSYCTACQKLRHPDYTDSCPNGLYGLFEMTVGADSVLVCVSCLEALEVAAYQALRQRKCDAEGGGR